MRIDELNDKIGKLFENTNFLSIDRFDKERDSNIFYHELFYRWAYIVLEEGLVDSKSILENLNLENENPCIIGHILALHAKPEAKQYYEETKKLADSFQSKRFDVRPQLFEDLRAKFIEHEDIVSEIDKILRGIEAVNK